MGCDKRKYRDRLDAKIALALTQRAAARDKGKRNEARVYHCPRCHAWHLTSLR